MRMKWLAGVIVLMGALLLGAAATWAQQPEGRGYREGEGAISQSSSGQAEATGERERGASAGIEAIAGTVEAAGGATFYRFSGASDDGARGTNGKRATVAHCTNIGSTTVTVGLGVLNYEGTVYMSSMSIPPGYTRTYATQFTNAYVDDLVLGSSGGTPPIIQGSGFIYSTNADAQIICTAQMIDPTGNPPEFVVNLPLTRP